MATLKVRFLDDGSVKLEVEGSVDAEIHDAVEADLDRLAAMMGGPVERKPRDGAPSEYRSHGHHGHTHRH